MDVIKTVNLVAGREFLNGRSLSYNQRISVHSIERRASVCKTHLRLVSHIKSEIWRMNRILDHFIPAQQQKNRPNICSVRATELNLGQNQKISDHNHQQNSSVYET